LPQTLSFPGVYIEELPSGVRTINGVPTSIVAFVGRARLGPVDEPTTLFSFDDFERQFGGLWPKSSLGYAVRDFYLNAPGGQAIIVRVPVTDPTEADATKKDEDVAATVEVPDLGLEASSPGAWGNALRASIDYDRLPADAATNFLFNLTVQLVRTEGTKEIVVASEVFRGFSADPTHPRRIDKALESRSKLVRLAAPLPTTPKRPAETVKTVDGKTVNVPVAAKGDGVDAKQGPGVADVKTGLGALAKADILNLLVIPPLVPPAEEDPGLAAEILAEAIVVAEQRRAMLLIDPPSTWDEPQDALTEITKLGDVTPYAAAFFPRIRKTDSTIFEGRTEIDFAPAGAVAGVFARTDAERGVWKAPAGLDAVLRGAPALSINLNDDQNGLLNPRGINCLRVKTGPARVVWGARTRDGDDDRASQWKYVPVRRLANFIEESLFRGTQWVVFEPNDEPLWASIRLNVGSFLHSLFRQGAFQGATPREAYFVKCDKFTTTQDDINRGIVNIVVGFAPLKPAEFVVLKLQQIAGSIET